AQRNRSTDGSPTCRAKPSRPSPVERETFGQTETMQLDEALKFLRANHRSVLVTHKRNGDPQLSPVIHGVDDKGRVVISSREPAYKVRNLRRDPRATLLGLNDGFFGKWVQVDGSAE